MIINSLKQFAVSYIGIIQYANESIESKELIKCIISEKSNTHVVPYSPIFWTLVTSTPHWLSSIKMVKLIGINSNKIISSRKSNEEIRIQRKAIRKEGTHLRTFWNLTYFTVTGFSYEQTVSSNKYYEILKGNMVPKILSNILTSSIKMLITQHNGKKMLEITLRLSRVKTTESLGGKSLTLLQKTSWWTKIL